MAISGDQPRGVREFERIRMGIRSSHDLQDGRGPGDVVGCNVHHLLPLLQGEMAPETGGTLMRVTDLEQYHASEDEKARTEDLLRVLPTGRRSVLDIGARDGYFSRLLTEHFAEVTALDLQKPPFEITRVTTIAGDATRLDFADDSFDCVFCTEVLEHIRDVQRACSEIVRVAKHEIIIGVPFQQDVRSGRTTCHSCGKINPPWGHVNSFDEGRLSALFPGLHVTSKHFVGTIKDATNPISTFLMARAGNPSGSYEQEEPCIQCGAKLIPPESMRIWQKVCSAMAARIDNVQALWVRPHANWIHLVFSKARSYKCMIASQEQSVANRRESQDKMRPIRSLKATARETMEILSAYDSAHKEARMVAQLEKRTSPTVVTPSRRHLEAGIGWIKRAQDSSISGGVAWGYRSRRPVRTVIPLGWVAPYPETTGYTIPTMLRFSDLSGDEDCLHRARRMTAWELTIQLEDGGIQGGTFGAQPVASSTFVTGQVLFGFLAAYNRFPAAAIRAGAIRAGEFLLDCLDGSGRFAKGYSQYCAPGAKAYEVRTGHALAELGDLLDDQRFRIAASRMADYALSVQEINGWFRENDLNDHDRPLTHTIGYVMEGLHGIGVRLGRRDCIEAVQRTLNHIVPLIRSDGFLAGRWRTDWTPAADWACLAGSAQIAGVFLRMHEQTKTPEYLEAGRKLLGFVCFTQDLRTGVPGLDGGIRGSHPFGGKYGQWCVLNCATKYFCDSVMDYLRIQGAAQR